MGFDRQQLESKRYIIVPLALALVINCSVYWGTRLITADAHHYDFSIWVDDEVPFVAVFIIPYVLAYLQWGIGFLLIALESREHCYRIMSGEITAKLICLAFFLFIPTQMIRADITGTGIWENLVNLIYRLDEPNNLFPSLHCMESWFCFRGSIGMKKVPRWYSWLMLAFTLLVFASTVLIKQHVALDIAGGVLIAEIGLFLVTKFKLYRLLARLERRITHAEHHK